MLSSLSMMLYVAMTSRSREEKDRIQQLADQWQKDRNKKAERKKLREEERLAQGGLGNGKLKGQKQTQTQNHNGRQLDLEDIEEMMRDLLTSVGPGAPKSITLPPLPKATRERVHLMARVFQLKSSSDGKRKAEVKSMTITRMKNTGTRPVNERKINTVLKRKGGPGSGAGPGIREGEVIGHQAEKISQENIGYKLLALMGYVLILISCCLFASSHFTLHTSHLTPHASHFTLFAVSLSPVKS